MNRDQRAGIRDQRVDDSAAAEFEATLRLIAGLPAPEGLADRVHAGLRAAPVSAPVSASARILGWPAALRPVSGRATIWNGSAMQSAPARMAAAAAIVFVVLGGGWGVSSFVASRVQTARPDRAVVLSPRTNAPGGFSTAGAMRTPQTLNRPVAARATTAQVLAVKAADRAAEKATHRAAKPAAAKKSARRAQPTAGSKLVAQPAAPR